LKEEGEAWQALCWRVCAVDCQVTCDNVTQPTRLLVPTLVISTVRYSTGIFVEFGSATTATALAWHQQQLQALHSSTSVCQVGWHFKALAEMLPCTGLGVAVLGQFNPCARGYVRLCQT